MTVVSNGRLVSDVRNKNGSHTTHWLQALPSATYLISVAIAPYARIHDQWRGIPGRLLCISRGQRARAPALRLHARHHRDVHQAHGRRVSVGQVRAGDRRRLLRRRGDGERHRVGRLASRQTRLSRTGRGTTGSSIPHELAHQWFGDDETTENWSHLWLNEGFAEFMNGAYWEAKLGRHVERRLLFRRVPAVHRDRCGTLDAARRRWLEQHLSQGRARTPHAPAPTRRRAILGIRSIFF